MVNRGLKIAADEIAVILQRLSVNGPPSVDIWMVGDVVSVKIFKMDDIGEYSEYAIGASDEL